MIYRSGHRMRFLAVRRILWPVFRPKCHFYGHRMRLEAIGRILWPARLREGDDRYALAALHRGGTQKSREVNLPAFL